jgi:hypothetical protein
MASFSLPAHDFGFKQHLCLLALHIMMIIDLHGGDLWWPVVALLVHKISIFFAGPE